MVNRKSEIATILMVGAVVVMGVTAVISSFTQNDKRTTGSRASCLSSQITCIGETNVVCCNKTTQMCGWNNEKRICQSKPITSSPTPTKKPSPTSLFPTEIPCNTTPISCGGASSKKYFKNSKNAAFSDFECSNPISITSYCAPTVSPTSIVGNGGNSCTNGKAGSGCGWTKDASQGYDTVACPTPYKEFNCCAKNGNRYGCVGTHCSAIGNGSTYVSCQAIPKATPTSAAAGGGATSGELYPQNDGRTPGMACCFRQGDRVRVYASAAAREGSGMNTPCTKAAYGNAYGADDWFECPDTIVGETDVATYEQIVTAAATEPNPPSAKCIAGISSQGQCTQIYMGWQLTNGNLCCPPEGNTNATNCQPASNSTECERIESDLATGKDYIFNAAEGLCCPKKVEMPTGEPTPEPTIIPEGCKLRKNMTCGSGMARYLPNQQIYNGEEYCCKNQGGNSETPPTIISTPIPIQSLSVNQRIKQYCSTKNQICTSPKYQVNIESTYYCCDFDPNNDTAFASYIKTYAAPGTTSEEGTFYKYYSCEKQYDCRDSIDANKPQCKASSVDILSDCSNECAPNGKICYMPKIFVYKPYLYCCNGKKGK